MSKKIIGRHRRYASRAKSGREIQRLAGSHIEHCQIYDKDDQRGPKILGCHQNQHMECRQSRGDHNIPEFQRPLEACRYKKYEDDLHQLRRLDADAAYRKPKFRAIGHLAYHGHDRKRYNPCNGIQVPPFRQFLKLADDDRNHETDCDGSCRYDILLDRLFIVQPGQHDHANTKEHAHIIYDQSGYLWINKRIQQNSSPKKYHLHQIKGKQLDILLLQIHHQKCDDMYREHQHVLPPKHPLLLIRIIVAKDAEAKVRIHRHQYNDQIFG